MSFTLNKESRVAVVGHGSWATGLVKILTDGAGGTANGNGTGAAGAPKIGWFVRNPEVLESLKAEGRNPRYLSDVEFPAGRLELSDDINAAVEGADVVILAAPSAYLKNYLEPLKVALDDRFVISAIKGIVPGNYLSVTEYLNRHHGLPLEHAGVIGGPSHAEEIALERLSYLTVACENLNNARVMTHKLSARYIRTTISDDIHGVEYAAILKNIYALAVGVASGLGYGDNFMSVLISNGAREMRRFLDTRFPYPTVEGAGGHSGRDTDTSAFLGDLLVTAYSPFSRNRRFGMMIGKGLHVKAAQMELGGVAEGYWASETVRHVNDGGGRIDMPIADAVYGVLYEGASPSKTIKNLTNKLI